jgi:ferredoxin
MEQATKNFFGMFGDGVGGPYTAMDGYIYLRWITRYLYHLRRGMEGDAQAPANDGGEAVDELIQASVRKLVPEIVSRETSTYHGKVITVEEAVKLVTIGKDITMPSLPETVIPYAKARDLILANPDSIAVVDCPCRMSKKDHCTPVDVCMVMGEPFAGFVLEHRVANARRLDRDEALRILKETDERGWVHSAWFKENLGGRFWVICNCCRCCCMAMKGHSLGLPMIAASGLVCSADGRCNGCGACVDACPFGAIAVDGSARIDPGKCMGCGACRRSCPVDALSLAQGPSDLRPLGQVLNGL